MRGAGLVAVGLIALAAGCSMRTAAQHQQELGSSAERHMTVGIVQREIRTGLMPDQVISALGSPNIVTRDGAGQETWVYDKVASEASYSRSGAYGTILLLGGGTSAGAASQGQRTLTVVIKFGSNQQVESFSYHASRF